MTKRVRRRPNYRIGDWYVVPLTDMAMAIGIVARTMRKGGILSYFFGPVRTIEQALTKLPTLTADNARFVAIHGDLGFLDEKWKVIASSDDWNPKAWPVPTFRRRDLLSGQVKMIDYNDELVEVSERESATEYTENMPEDGLYGYVAGELKLKSLFGLPIR